MKKINPQIKRYEYPTGKPYWRVSCTIPGEGRYLKKYSTEQEAARDRMRLIRSYQGGGLEIGRMRAAEIAYQKLENCENPDARRKDLLQVVEWFIENYKENRFERPLNEYVDDFLERKKKRRSAKTIKEIDYYHPWRTHRSLDQDAPDGRPVRSAELGQVVEFPVVEGLHHYYLPRAA